MIELSQATRVYGTVIGINDISVSLAPGAYGLLGPNGAGKTTMLNLLTGQLHPTMGTVRVFGEDPRNNARVLRRLGVCPGDEAMYTNVSGWAWVRHLLVLHGYDPPEAGERAVAALRQLAMSDFMHQTIGTYSRGMRQRTKMAQAIAHDPELLILDEPFNGLDPIGRHDVTEFLRAWMRRGRSLLLSSHILSEVEAISDTFLFISGGRLLATGTQAELRALLPSTAQTLRIRCRQPRALAAQLWRCEATSQIRLEPDGLLVVVSSQPEQIWRALPGWVAQTGDLIEELDCGDVSLQSLFDTLMRNYRGAER
ncbi:MAG: ABC transporter ATP-binding protein [Pirellulaceae bacterium]